MKVCFFSLFSGIVKRGIESWLVNLIQHTKRIDPSLDYTLVSGGKVAIGDLARNHLLPLRPRILPPILNNKLTNYLAILGISPSNIYNNLCSLTLLPFLLRESFDVYIPNDYFQIILCKLARRLKGEKSKIISVGHAGPGHDDWKTLKLEPDFFVALTQNSLEWAEGIKTKRTKIKLIPAGVDSSLFNTRVKPAANPFKNNYPTILCVGALVPYKRQILAVRAISSLRGVNLLLIGEGPEKEAIFHEASSLINGGRFILIPSVKHEELPAFYSLAEALTLPSTDRENSPGVVIESMACGKPVICTDYPRLRWMAGDGGVFVDPENTDNYAATIEGVLKESKNYKEKALERSKYFDFRSVAERWLELYH